MKKIILLICLVLVQGISFSQTMEVIADVRKAEGLYLNSLSTIVDDVIYTIENSTQSILVTNIKTNKKIEKKIYDLNSKVHNISNLRKNYRDLSAISVGRVVGENVEFLIQTMGKEDKVNITRTTLDAELNVVEEKLLLSYDLAHTQMSGPVFTGRIFKYNELLGLYFYGGYYAVPKKDDYLRTVIFNSNMEIITDNSFYLDNKDTDIGYTSVDKYVGSANIIDEETVVLNIAGTLFRIKESKFSPIPLNLKVSIDSYVMHSNGNGGVRFVGCYKENDKASGLAVFDFDEDMSVTFEKFIPIPEKLNASQKEITGEGFTESLKWRSFRIIDFNVNKDGTTDVGLYLKGDIILSFSFIKLDNQMKIVDQLVIPYGVSFQPDINLVFENGKIILIHEDYENWYNDSGAFNSSSYPNRKSNNLILTCAVIPSDNFGRFTRNQIKIDKFSWSELSTKKQLLRFYNIKTDKNSYLISLGEGSYRTGYSPQYLGKISF